MIEFTPLRISVWGRLALLLVVLLAGLGLRPDAAWASHLRAGDIQAKVDTTAGHNPRRIFFKMILYTDNGSQVTQPTATIFFGDNTSSCENGVVRASIQVLPRNPDTSVNIYYFEHTFPSTGSFIVSFIGENRNAGVLNMTDSGNQSFYISTTIYIDPALGLNHSAILTSPAVDKAAMSQVFLHNPGGYDADGDSLAYHLRTSQKVAAAIRDIVGPGPGCPNATGNNQFVPVTVPDFRYPNDPLITGGTVPPQVPYNGTPAGAPGSPAIFVQDVNTGQITWNAPLAVGFYNVAMEIEEWRRTPLGVRKIGVVIRDMQIIVSATSNLRPILTIPADICVVAGLPVTGIVTAVDGGTGAAQTPIVLSAYSGILPPATFTQSLTGPPLARGTFNWQTQCNNVARLPYLVVFKAQDTPAVPATAGNPPLIDEQVWRITVVGPPPQNLQAVPDASTGINRTLLSWNTYTCANASRIYIYRKENSGTAPGPCVTGIPASTGYVQIGSVPATAVSFVDNNTSAGGVNVGLDRGKTYCYRIYADFPLPAGGASLASQEACAAFTGRSAQLKNVDVETTSPNAGQITVRWTQPRPAPGLSFDGTPSYVLSRGEGLAPTSFATVRTFTALTDTSFVDTNLNTQSLQYTYKLAFVRTFSTGQTPVTETAATASSVRTTVQPNNPPTSFSVTWSYNVPWDNSAQPTVIYRRMGTTGAFTQIGTATSGANGGIYVDRDPTLARSQSYCYYVRTEGRYAPTGYLSSLLNKSQVQCADLIAPPCAPVLALQTTNCDSLAALQEFPGLDQRYANHLRWKVGNLPAGCDATIASYRVYYRPAPTG
ncbi:fibronectin type III domain-containing protein, partial [Hymenobacter terricola]|uniref:hypothetical protein n=1 Tax=Hymenobacter terricola TaxID=2819236 RepID=UPI001CF382AB